MLLFLTDMVLQVIDRADSSIHMFSYLDLPVDQRRPMDTSYNRLMAIARAIFCQRGWHHSKRIQDSWRHFLLFCRCLFFAATLNDP